MHTELKQYTVAELCDGFVYNTSIDFLTVDWRCWTDNNVSLRWGAS
jgi:hypothetical protein